MIYLLGLISGGLIGMIGVGGILLAPLLELAGIDFKVALATCSFSFLFTGITGTLAYAKKKSISWRMVSYLSVGVIPGAMVGAATNVALDEWILKISLGSLIGFSGLYSFAKKRGPHNETSDLRAPVLILIGLLVGFGSALTGTGGPVLLIPVLIILRVRVLLAIAVSQVIQLPTAIFATIGFLDSSQIDFILGTGLGVVQAIAVFAGAKIAHSISVDKLRDVVSAALILVAISMIYKAVVA